MIHQKKWAIVGIALLALVVVGYYSVLQGLYHQQVRNHRPLGEFVFCHYAELGYQGSDTNPVYKRQVYYSKKKEAVYVENAADTRFPGLEIRGGAGFCTSRGTVSWNVGDSVAIYQPNITVGLDQMRELWKIIERVRNYGNFLGQQTENGVVVDVYRIQDTDDSSGLPFEITVAYNPQGLPVRIEQDFPAATATANGVTSNRAIGYRTVKYPIEYTGDDSDALFNPPAGMRIE